MIQFTVAAEVIGLLAKVATMLFTRAREMTIQMAYSGARAMIHGDGWA